MFVKLLTFTLSILLMSGCTSFSKQVEMPVLNTYAFDDYQGHSVESPEDIFYLTDEAKSFVDKHAAGQVTHDGKVTELLRAIFSRTELNLDYSSNANTTASETFEAAEANCLSLTIMTYAMLQHLGIKADFQEVEIPEFWTRRNGYTLLNDHVNLRIKAKVIKGSHPLFLRDMIVDFDPQPGISKFPEKELTKQQIVANFYNNKGAEHLLMNSPSKAFAYFVKALEAYPKNEGTWLNLGALYRQHGLPEDAEKAYQYALYLDPEFNTAYENLAVLYRLTDREEQAQTMQSTLHKKRSKNPYYHMMLGETSLQANNPQQAIKHFNRAIQINHKPHQFYFGLARALYRIGELDASKKALEKAHDKAGDTRIADHYANKISLLASAT
ncbi:tetratricopeptide repeat protein [Glaciecola sp. 1036]|uniref:tetratricopeptide repeat protein n=1 Tax=Alteromonadaceae TaxID=72275 RepID=UPI003D091172